MGRGKKKKYLPVGSGDVSFGLSLPHTCLLILGIYVYSRFPHLPGGDTGELLAEACHLGTAHPPGYPLFTILYHFFMRLSPLPPATTANLISCLQGALAAYFIGRTVSVLLGREGAASSLAAVFFALSPLTWEYSVGAEVFCLNNLLISVVIFLTTCICSNEYDNKDKLRCAKLGAFVSGLCLSNQHTSLLFLLVLIPVVYSKIYDIQPAIFTLKTLSLFFLLGLSPYIYLYYASSPHDGSWGDLSSIDGFIKHLTRSEYGSLKLAPTDRGAQEVPLERIWIWLIDLRSRQIGYIGVAAAVVGLSRSAVNRQLGKQLTPLLLTLVFYTVIWNFVFSNLPLDNSVPMAFEVHSR